MYGIKSLCSALSLNMVPFNHYSLCLYLYFIEPEFKMHSFSKCGIRAT